MSHPDSRRTAVLGLRLLAGLFVLLGGALVTLGFLQQSEPGGFLTSPTVGLATSTRAMSTTEVEVSTGQPADPSSDVGDLARVRIRATSPDSSVPFFLGIARTSDVQEYLRDVDHDQMTSVRTDPPGLFFAHKPGPRTPSTPAQQPFWSAATVSSGADATLEWDKRGGAWSAVAMTTDGRSGLSLRADIGLRFAFLLPLGAGLLAAGIGCALASVTVGRHGTTATRAVSQDDALRPMAVPRRPD